jgi:Flagella basal body rod protein.
MVDPSMDNTTSIILSRMITASRTVDVIANNIANVSTPGYEATHLQSAAWIDRMRGVTAPPGGSTLAYTQATGTWRDAPPAQFTRPAIRSTSLCPAAAISRCRPQTARASRGMAASA